MRSRVARVMGSCVAGSFAVVLVWQSAGLANAAEGQEVTVHSGKVDITHGVGTEPIDQVDIVMTFTNTETADGSVCEGPSDSPVTQGVIVTLQQGSCGSGVAGAQVTIPHFTPRPKAKALAKFEGTTVEGARVDALLRTLGTPAGTCGMWNLKLDAVPLDLSSITTNPVALSITLADGSYGCVTVSKARIDR